MLSTSAPLGRHVLTIFSDAQSIDIKDSQLPVLVSANIFQSACTIMVATQSCNMGMQQLGSVAPVPNQQGCHQLATGCMSK